MKAITLKSARSHAESIRTAQKAKYGREYGIKSMEFENFIQHTCKKFECPISISVTREVKCDSTSKAMSLKRPMKYKRKSVMSRLVNLSSSTSSSEEIPVKPFSESALFTDDHTLYLIAYYDVFDELIEINISKFKYQEVPRMLMQLIAYKVPYTRNLTKFTIKSCHITMYTLYELSKILQLTHITDVCLDHSPLKEGNYDILLSQPSKIQNLSLSRCNINDDICERIAALLHLLEPAESTLMTLNLASNHITDLGCKYLGEALRSNRHLRYLNISDNHIGDDGALYIFQMLTEFPLSDDEVLDKNRRYVCYLKQKEEVYKAYVAQLILDEKIRSKAKKGTSMKNRPALKKVKESRSDSSAEEHHKKKARAASQELLGPFNDPFSQSCVKVKDGRLYCVGNLVLSYLNLAYNNLTYISIKTLLAVVSHQKLNITEDLSGLVNVLVEGNYMPADCIEYHILHNELQKGRSRKKTVLN